MNIDKQFSTISLSPKDKFTQFVDARQVNAAFAYLDIPKSHKKQSKYLVIGRGEKTRMFLKMVELPPIPLLADNKNLRLQMKPREKSPLYRVIAAACIYKLKSLREEIKLAIEREKQSPPYNYPILYRLEPPFSGEKPNIPLTWEEYQVFCADEAPNKN